MDDITSNEVEHEEGSENDKAAEDTESTLDSDERRE